MNVTNVKLKQKLVPAEVLEVTSADLATVLRTLWHDFNQIAAVLESRGYQVEPTRQAIWKGCNTPRDCEVKVYKSETKTEKL